MTLKVNLQKKINYYVMTRTVKKGMLCGQRPKKKIPMCSYPNQQLKGYVVTRTVNLLDVTRKSVQGDQCAMTRTVHLSNMCICSKQHSYNLLTRRVVLRNFK